jgi:hypothetical protein
MARRFPTCFLCLGVALVLALAAKHSAHAQVSSASCTSSLPAATVIATFGSAAQFAARQTDLGTALGDDGSMASFAYDNGAANGGYLSVRPANVTSLWSVTTLLANATAPAAAAAVLSVADAAGAVVAFELGPGDPALFTVQLVVQATASNVTSAKTFPVEVQLYYTPPLAGNTAWTTVRIPVQHFGLPTTLPVLAAIQFTKFPAPYGAAAPVVRFDTLRLEYNPCPRKLTLLPPQTCATSTLLVDDFASNARYAAKKNALGGDTTTHVMTTVKHLSATDPLGQGVLLNATRADAYWSTNLLSPTTGAGCLVAWPYTTLRVRVSASLGASFTLEMRRMSDDCTSYLGDFLTLDSSYLANFTGLSDVYTIDVPLAKLPRNPYASIAVSGFTRTPGAPTDGQSGIAVILRSVSLERDCVSLANDAVELRPPVIDWCGPSDVPKVALSFDGPADYTHAVLDLFRAEGVRATFFIQPGLIVDRYVYSAADYDAFGYALQAGPDSESCRIVRRVVNEGHSLGDHSYTHPRYGSTLWGGRHCIRSSRSRASLTRTLGGGGGGHLPC